MDKLNAILESTELPGAPDGEALYNKSLITDRDGESPLRPFFRIRQGDKEIPFGHPRSAILNHGSDKGGKGRLNASLSVAWLNGSFGPILCESNGRKAAIIHSDDHRYGLWKLDREISRLAGVKDGLHERLLVFSVRAWEPLDMMFLLETIIKKHPDIGLVILDLVWDWVSSVNNEEENKLLTDKILGLADRHNFLVVVTTHESRLSRQAKGHQGAIWSAKSETVFAVKKRRGTFIATPVRCRGEEFGRIVFQYNGSNFTFLDDHDFQPKEKQILGDFTQTGDEKHVAILSRLAKERITWKPGELRNRLRTEYSKAVAPIGVNLSKNLLKYYRDRDWIFTNRKEYSIRNGLEHAS
ncbi:MAG: hypothetical protein KF803_02535 [Cyclobacteriaceae bacterium]|nr:hypothetical protein [Cyclobacteriaceae bacterium]